MVTMSTNISGSSVALFQQRARGLAAGVGNAKREAAATANRVSKRGAIRIREQGPKRPNRNWASIRSTIDWKADDTKGFGVHLNVDELDRKAKHWIIQEVGTEGSPTAVLKNGGTSNPKGRPAKNAQYSRKIPSQKGRKIGPGLAFYGSGDFRKQALVWASTAPGVNLGTLTIDKEIRARHFIRYGSEAGFRTYRTTILAAARENLGKKK